MTAHTPINPLLQSLLPEMIERLSGAKRQVGDILRPVAVDLQAVVDFLDFEVSRAELELSKAEWSSRADTDAIEVRVRHLKGLRAGVDQGSVSTMLEQIEQVILVLMRLDSEAD